MVTFGMVFDVRNGGEKLRRFENGNVLKNKFFKRTDFHF